MERRPNPVTESIDGATGDITMSGDAMRWSPELAEGQGRAASGPLLPGSFPGVDVAAGFGSLLGLDGAGMRRLVSGAVTSLATVANDVVAELRQLTRAPEVDTEVDTEVDREADREADAAVDAEVDAGVDTAADDEGPPEDGPTSREP